VEQQPPHGITAPVWIYRVNIISSCTHKHAFKLKPELVSDWSPIENRTLINAKIIYFENLHHPPYPLYYASLPINQSPRTVEERPNILQTKRIIRQDIFIILSSLMFLPTPWKKHYYIYPIFNRLKKIFSLFIPTMAQRRRTSNSTKTLLNRIYEEWHQLVHPNKEKNNVFFRVLYGFIFFSTNIFNLSSWKLWEYITILP
jgi:hypothetical protein